MPMSAAATWLNSFFSGYDEALLSLLHKIAEAVGVVLTPLMKLITLLGEKGIIFFLLALVFMCFSRTRRLGVCIFGAVCCGALITNLILKDAIARPRPFVSSDQFRQWWVALGSPAEDGFSFPSGHVTAAAAGMTAISLMKGKRWILPSVLVVFIMGVARNYLMAHYPSDVLFAVIVGVFSGVAAFIITRLIFTFLEDRSDTPVFALILDYDLPLRLPDISSLRSGKRGSAARPSSHSASAPRTTRRTGGAARPSAHSASAPRTTGRTGGAGYRGKHER